MGLLDEIVSKLGGTSGDGDADTRTRLQNMAGGRGNFADPASADHSALSGLMSHVPQGVLQQVLGGVAGGMDRQSYSQHATPGVGGTDPFGSLGGSALSMIASALIGKLTGPGGQSGQSLLSKIPGLSTIDPNQMNSNQVSQVAQYAQQNHPDQFGQAAAEVGQQQPSLLGTLMGQGGLSQAASALASHVLGGGH